VFCHRALLARLDDAVAESLDATIFAWNAFVFERLAQFELLGICTRLSNSPTILICGRRSGASGS
jgi:hypothetical protein